FKRASIGEIATRMNEPAERVMELLASATKKMYAARLQRPTPYIDKTVYVGWNSLCVSAYLEAAKVLELNDAKRFALRSLDRVLSSAWKPSAEADRACPELAEGSVRSTLLHVVAYSDSQAEHREVPGMLDDYAFTALACLDAYEATSDLSYFKFARGITDAMIARFFDPTSGGFFDSEPASDAARLGVLSTPRKPLQDSPTPAGNPMAAIALIRIHHYTGDTSYRDKAEQTLETFAQVAEQFGIFAATYGIAVLHFLEAANQIVVIEAEADQDAADKIYEAAVAPFAFGKAVIKLGSNQAVRENLPPALAETIPSLPELKSGKSFAVFCSGSTCKPPIFTAAELRAALLAASE
ncbi:MAG: thioredoxin domain-containing protein, partial [Candidatus Sulfotelmatobacter sp.]